MSTSVNFSTAQLLAETSRVVMRVVQQGNSLDDALQPSAAQLTAPQRSALQALSFGTLRWYQRLVRLIELLTSRPTDTIQPPVHALLAVALHQLNFSHHPSHAIGNAAVEAARVLGQARASGFVNAVLRNFLRQQEELRQRTVQELVGEFAHPKWFIERVRADWPNHWRGILEANNQQPPMWLRVNRLQGSAAEYRALLEAQGIQASTVESLPDAVLLERPVDVSQLPGFDTGRASVQDGGAQLAAPLLDVKPGMRVLDACAAPGGKACHLIERTPELQELVILDRSAGRLKQVEENLARENLRAALGRHDGSLRLIAGDAGRPEEWWQDTSGTRRPFDRILLDVPCSASGVIRRHPDIKLLRRPADIPALAAEQLRLLKNLWPLLAPGGRLLYVSCSVLQEENGGVVGSFLTQEPSARGCGLPEGGAGMIRPTKGPGRQILPGTGLHTASGKDEQAGLDGFYYACLEKH